MTENTKPLTPRRALISTWIVIGMSIIMIIAVTALAIINYNREQKGMRQMLREKGAALIKSFEAGTRTGMMGRFGSGARLQTLLSETALQVDILYIALVDSSGKILAHNDPAMIGRQFLPAEMLTRLGISEQTAWRIIHQGKQPISFEVYKKFLPIPPPRKTGYMQRMRMSMHQGENGEHPIPRWMEGLPGDRILDPDKRPVIFIGMDPASYVTAMKEDFLFTLVTSAIILLLGLAGVVSLFWAQSYARSRKLLQDSRAFAAEMVANLPEGIIVTGPDHRLSFINRIAGDMLKLDPGTFLGSPAADILPASLNTLLYSLSRQSNIVEQELTLGGPDGVDLTVAVTATHIISEVGDFVGTMFILRDLSQIRKLQETVQQQEKLAAIGNLAAGVAHEVRNPLSSIKGYATYFASLFEQDSEKKKAAEVMTAEVDRLNRVISELLEISRPSDLKCRETDITFLLDASLRLVRQDAESSSITITTDIDQAISPIWLDPDRITQALINLYINGIQAMPDGGQLIVSARDRDGNLEVTISDTGRGIPKDIQKKVFNPYFTTKNTGTGLGLAVVLKIIEAHSGTIEVTSTNNEGTKFTIVLPRNKKTEE